MESSTHQAVHGMLPEKKDSSWTWADQLSSYRFWGLLAFYVLTFIGSGAFNYLFLFKLMREAASKGSYFSDSSTFSYLVFMGSIPSLYLAWAAARKDPKPVLYTAVIMILSGIMVSLFPELSLNGVLLIPGAFLLGLGSGTIGLAVPVILADGRGGAKMMVISLGILGFVGRIGDFIAPIAGQVFSDLPQVKLLILLPILLGVGFLVPVKKSFFADPPRRHGQTSIPDFRYPVSVSLSFILPFYYAYWIYKVHREVRNIAPSKGLLSQRAAVLIFIFLPILTPVILASLADALGGSSIPGSGIRRSKASSILLWGIFLYPVAFGKVQSLLNQAAEDARRPPPADDPARDAS